MVAREFYERKDADTLTYRLHAGQAKAYRSTARFVFVISGAQGGKTTFVPLWLDREIDEKGQGDYLAATATYDLFKLKLYPELRNYFVLNRGWNEDKSDRVFWRQEKPRIFSRIILRSAASEGGLESATVKGAVLDECGQDDFRITAWEAVQRRAAIHQARILGTTTPYNMGWLKTEIYDRWRANDPNIQVIQFASTANPAFPKAEFDRLKATMAAWKFNMFYKGEFTRPAGMIYGDFIDDYMENGGHKVHPFTIKRNWRVFVGLDFGGVHTASIWLAHDLKADVYYLFHETLEGGLTTLEHANRARAFAKPYHVIRYTGGAPSENQYRWDWNAAGISVQKPQVGDVEGGIDRVIALFKEKRIYIFDNCKMVLDELGTYSRKVDDYGQPTEDIKDKEKYHLLDALRYCVIGAEYSGVGVDFAG